MESPIKEGLFPAMELIRPAWHIIVTLF